MEVNISYSQNNLKLMGHRQFDFKELFLVHHTLVDYFMMHGTKTDLSSPKPTVVNVMAPRIKMKLQRSLLKRIHQKQVFGLSLVVM
jgi:hypothetical protein